jgi:hypothetical protein
MDALQYICMDIGARISSDIDKYVNPKKNLKEQFDEHERILKGIGGLAVFIRLTVLSINIFPF